MNLVDMGIILFVSILLAFIIYFKIIKTRGNIGCNCSMKSSCSLKINTMDAIFSDIKKDYHHE